MSTTPTLGDQLGDAVNAMTTGALDGTDRPSAPLSERLLRAIRGHVTSEADTLGEAKALLDATDDPIVHLVLAEYLEEEQRHHDLFERLAQHFAEELEPIGRQTTLPANGRRKRDPQLAERLGELGKHERQGIARLRDLAKENRKEYGGVLSLLLEMVALDSTKHERMLKFAQKAVA